MIKCEIEIDGNEIRVNGKSFVVDAEYSYDIVTLGDDSLDWYSTIEQAIRHCMGINEDD